jgi:hypothetical protein
MAIMTYIASVAANTTIANAMSGKSAEFVTEPSIVTLGAGGSAVGLNFSLIIGEEVVVDDQEGPVLTTLPAFPDQILAQGGGLPGNRIIVKVRNTTGGALTAYVKVMVEPA